MKKVSQSALLVAAMMMTPVAPARGQEFYETRLRAGQAAFLEKRMPEALDNLRIASFGLLEKPALEAEALAYLALAQNAAGRPSDVDATLGRFLEVERRFAPYAQMKLNPAMTAEFQALLKRRVAQDTLLAYPGLAVLVETEEQKLAKLPPKDRQKAYEAAARREPRNPKWPLALARDAAAVDDQRTVIVWTSKAIEIDPTGVEARVLRAHALVLKGDWAGARLDLDAVPSAELSKHPTLVADRFVCLVEVKDWSGAADASKTLPPSETGRADVAKARQKLAAQAPPN